MVKFEWNGEKFRIYFTHRTRFVSDLRYRGITFGSNVPVNSARRCTECSLQDESGKVLATGISVCNPQDNFCRKEGRHKALIDLLRDSNHLSSGVYSSYIGRDARELRKQFNRTAWEAYFRRCR